MKQDKFDLRSALPGEPESCHLALMQAARSVEEEEPVKKFAFRTVLIAALIIVSLMAVAVAATNGGLANWFQKDYGVALPQSAQEVLSATEETTLETDLVTFTVNELLCDGKIAYMAAEAQLKNQGTAILYPDAADPTDRIGEQLAAELNRSDIDAQTSYAEAAKLTGLPLYNVAAWVEVSDELPMDSEMMDGDMLENGNLLLVRMLYFMQMQDVDTLPMTIVTRVKEVNVDTLEFVEGSERRLTAEIALPIHGVTAQRSYQPEETGKLSGCFTLTSVEAKQTCAGVYVTLKTKADEPMTMDAFFEMNDEWHVMDAQGNLLPIGMSLTGEWLDGNGESLVWNEETMLDELQFMCMISVDELPESMIVTDGTVQIAVK